jgi:aspartate/methionine/tyrosine aminotransferase
MRYQRSTMEREAPDDAGVGAIAQNLAESSIGDVIVSDLHFDLGDLALSYMDHRGKPELRDLVAAEADGLTREDVLITTGASSALFIVATALLDAAAHAVVAFPNYVTNFDTPRTIGCGLALLEQRFEEDYRVDLARLAALITPRTRLVSLTTPHNPTGAVMSEEQLRQAIAIVERSDAYLLVDETYRDMMFGPKLPLAASLSPRVISVSAVSKAFGLPGLRIGWLVCRDRTLMETLLAAKEQIFICNSVLTEEIAFRFLSGRDARMPGIRSHIERNFGIMQQWIGGEGRLEWVAPRGGVVCFPRIKAAVALNIDRFYRTLREEHRVAIGPGDWFEVDRRNMRLGFGHPSADELTVGLQAITAALDSACDARSSKGAI